MSPLSPAAAAPAGASGTAQLPVTQAQDRGTGQWDPPRTPDPHPACRAVGPVPPGCNVDTHLIVHSEFELFFKPVLLRLNFNRCFDLLEWKGELRNKKSGF